MCICDRSSMVRLKLDQFRQIRREAWEALDRTKGEDPEVSLRLIRLIMDCLHKEALLAGL